MTARSKQLGIAFERRVVQKAKAANLRAGQQPGSGEYRDFPNDAWIEDWLIECKVRSGEHVLTVDLDWLKGVRANALRVGKRDGAVVVNRKGDRDPFVILDLDTFFSLLTQIRGIGVDNEN